MDDNAQADIEELTRFLLRAIGEDDTRPGLVDTPARVGRFWREFIDYDAGRTATVFEAVHADQLVVVSDMRVYSLCEHHLLPFWVDISIGYLANGHVLGLSKFARIAQRHAHRLQIQERLIDDIAKEVMEVTGADSVGVVGEGVHMCMVMRGIKTPHVMKSSALYGAFRDNADLRREFLGLT